VHAAEATASVRRLHDSCRGLVATFAPVLAAFEVDWTGRSLQAGDRGLAVAVSFARSYVASMHAVVTHVLSLEHLWDERHLPQLVTQRPVLIVEVPIGPTGRDAWRRAVESLAYGTGLGAAAVEGLRARGDLIALTRALEGSLVAADAVADALESVQPVLTDGPAPPDWAAAARPGEDEDEAAPAAPEALGSLRGGNRRAPWWGRMDSSGPEAGGAA